MKRTLVYVLALATVLFSLAGCSTTGAPKTAAATTPPATASAAATAAAESAQTADSSTPDYLNLDTTMPVVKDGKSLTLKVVSVQSDGYSATPKDHWIWAFFKKYCNLDLDVKYYQASSWSEQRNLLFTSGDLPDIFYQCAFSANDMVQYGQAEGMLYPLDKLIEKYAPLLQTAIVQNPSIRVETTTPDGHMYCIPEIAQEDVDLSTARVFINQSWLDKLGLKMPSTLDELTAALKAFKANDPNGNGQADEIPWLGSAGTGTVILTALGINADLTAEPYVRSDGKIGMAVTDPNYIHYLEYMKQLVADGLVNSDLYTMTQEQINATLSKNIVGLSAMAAPFVYMPDQAQYRQYQSLVPLTSAYSSEKVWPGTSAIRQGTFAVAYNSKYPEACMRMLNVFFEQGMPLLFWLGPVKSDTYETEYKVDGWDPILFKFNDATSSWDGTCPDGTDAWTYINNHIGIVNGGPVGFMYKQEEMNKELGRDSLFSDPEQYWRSSLKQNVSPYEKLKLPTLFYDVKSLERANELITPITDYIKTTEAKFVMGSEPLENIDDFNAQLKTLGVDEYLQICQTAYDAFVANSK